MLDISDILGSDRDIQFVNTDKYRAFNLLNRHFPDNPYIGIDIVEIIEDGISIEQIKMVLFQYLASFNVVYSGFVFDVNQYGKIDFEYTFN